MSEELLEKLRWKNEVYRIWKYGLATWGEYKNIVRICRDATWKVKTPSELYLSENANT